MTRSATHRDGDPDLELMVCDLCNRKGGIRWTYLTPCTATQEEVHGQPPWTRDGDRYWCSDERWAVCQQCHVEVQAGRKEAIKRRSADAQMDSILVVPESPAITMSNRMAQLMFIDATVDAFFDFMRGDPIPEPVTRATRAMETRWEDVPPFISTESFVRVDEKGLSMPGLGMIAPADPTP